MTLVNWLPCKIDPGRYAPAVHEALSGRLNSEPTQTNKLFARGLHVSLVDMKDICDPRRLAEPARRASAALQKETAKRVPKDGRGEDRLGVAR